MSTPVCVLPNGDFVSSFRYGPAETLKGLRHSNRAGTEAKADNRKSTVMRLNHGLHLAYCTNIHRGETWHDTFESLQTHVLAVRDRVCPKKPFAIGLRLSNRAARELSNPETLLAFQRWLTQKNCYIFTMNGFPYGQFHGIRVKEQVYLPDWTSPERLAYTNLLFDLLAKILPPGVEGSVSTLPVSFKGFHLHA